MAWNTSKHLPNIVKSNTKLKIENTDQLTCICFDITISTLILFNAESGETDVLGDLDWVCGFPRVGDVIGCVAICKNDRLYLGKIAALKGHSAK